MFSSAVYFDELNSSGIFPQNSLWIYEMEQSFDFIVDEDQPPLEESSYFEDDEEEVEVFCCCVNVRACFNKLL